MKKKEIIELIKKNGGFKQAHDENLRFEKVESYILLGYILFNEDIIYTIKIREGEFFGLEYNNTNDEMKHLKNIIKILEEKANESSTLNDNYFLSSPANKKLNKIKEGLTC